MVDGPSGGPIEGDLAFHLLADGVVLTATAPLALLTGSVGFQEISRTYDATSLAGHVGESLTVIIGVEDSNNFGNRMIWDNISLTVGASAFDPGTVITVRGPDAQ